MNKSIRLIMESHPDGFAVINKQGRILYWNPALEKITGIAQECALYLPIWEIQAMLMPVTYTGSYLESQKRFWESKKSEALLRAAIISSHSDERVVFTKNNGESVIAETTTYVTTSGRYRYCVCAVVKDVTDQKKRELALEARGNAANHEMRTPLNAVIGFTDLLLDGNEFALPAEIIPYMKIIKDSGRRVLAIAEKSMLFDRLESGDYRIQKYKVVLKEFLADLTNSFQPIELSHNVKFDLLPDLGILHQDGSPTTFQAEPDLLRSVLDNLIVNAAEAANPNDRRISITVHWQEKLTFVVHNYGEVSEEIRPRLFQKRATFGKTNGNGLGLYLSRLIAEAHGGNISCSSDNGETFFVVQIPLK